jgi:hypothetical protein
MAGIDDFTPAEYGKSSDGGKGMGENEGPTLTGGGGEMIKGGGGGMYSEEHHDLVASGEITLSFGWEYDPTSD